MPIIRQYIKAIFCCENILIHDELPHQFLEPIETKSGKAGFILSIGQDVGALVLCVDDRNKSMKCHFFGTQNIKKNISKWTSRLEINYTLAEISFYPISDKNNYEIVLTESLRQFIQTGVLTTIDISATWRRHRIQLAAKIRDLIEAQKDIDEKTYRELISELNIIFKHAVLHARRKKIDLSSASLSKLEEIKSHDKLLKHALYQKEITEIGDFLPYLSHVTLAYFVCCETPQDLLIYLRGEQERHLIALKKWEIKLEEQLIQARKSYKARCFYFLKKTAVTLYSYTWIGFGAEFFNWIGRLINAVLAFIPGSQVVKRSYVTISHHVVFCITRSERLARAASLTSHSEILPLGCKFIGGVAGGFLIYSSSGYYAGKMLFTTLLGRYISEQLTQLDDKRASVNYLGYKLFKPSMVNIVRILGVIVAVGESIYFQDCNIITEWLGGMIVSLLLLQLFSSKTTNRVAAEQKLLEFIFTIAGHEVGRALVRLANDISKQVVLCETATKAFVDFAQQRDWRVAKARCTTAWSPLFFGRQRENTMQVSWVNNGKFHETNCELFMSSASEGLARCEWSNDSKILRLNH